MALFYPRLLALFDYGVLSLSLTWSVNAMPYAREGFIAFSDKPVVEPEFVVNPLWNLAFDVVHNSDIAFVQPSLKLIQ